MLLKTAIITRAKETIKSDISIVNPRITESYLAKEGDLMNV